MVYRLSSILCWFVGFGEPRLLPYLSNLCNLLVIYIPDTVSSFLFSFFSLPPVHGYYISLFSWFRCPQNCSALNFMDKLIETLGQIITLLASLKPHQRKRNLNKNELSGYRAAGYSLRKSKSTTSWIVQCVDWLISVAQCVDSLISAFLQGSFCPGGLEVNQKTMLW